MPAAPPTLIRHVRAWPRRVGWTIAITLGVLVVARLALTPILHHQINRRLQNIPGYTGHVEDLSVHLWRGAYTLRRITLERQQPEVNEPFFFAKKIDFSLAWSELRHRRILSRILIEQGELNFVRAEHQNVSQLDVDSRWQEVIQDIFPIDITHLDVKGGLIRYLDLSRKPPVDLYVTSLRASATGLRNRPRATGGGEFPAQLNLDGETLGGGTLQLELKADPLADQPHFHLNFKLHEVNLPSLNEFLKAYAHLDVSQGKFQLVGEMAARDGGFEGYVKPFFEDLDFRNLRDQDKGIGAQLWERVVAGFAWIVKNKSRDQVATRIPFAGTFGDTKVGLLATFTNLFRNGFIRAFSPTLEGSVDAAKVQPEKKGPPDGVSKLTPNSNPR